MKGLNNVQAAAKRAFDLLVAIVGLIVVGWLIPLAAIAATVDTRQCGFFAQRRIGLGGRFFWVIKLRTMRSTRSQLTSVTTSKDMRITPLGRVLRGTKLDELPQLINILAGDMSLVGPRPDVPGFADRLTGEERIVLSVRPGITGPATLKYRDEEQLLAEQAEPEEYNRTVIYPDKVRINMDYVRDWTFCGDLAYIWKTVIGGRGG